MGIDDPTGLSGELLEDFYAECEEHLKAIRQSLVALDGSVPPNEKAARVEKIFRGFHSLKGMVGMTGIRAAEELAHRAEDYLRELLRGRLEPTAEGLDLLANAVEMLDRIIAAFREKKAYPDVDPLIERFSLFLASPGDVPPEPPRPAASGTTQSSIEDARERGLSVWKATFIPSPALNERGVNVGNVRERLSSLGELIHTSPRVGEHGSIAFEFLVATASAPDPGEWSKDGIRMELMAEPVSAVRSGAQETAAVHAGAPSSHVIRVDLHRLDELMRMAGELVIQRARLEEQMDQLASAGADVRGLRELNLAFAGHFRDLRAMVMRLRLVPIAEIFDRMPFAIRDLTRGSLKRVRMDVRGQTTELDKYLVERLKEPLLHLVRNAVGHGIELPHERAAAGKPAEATLTLSAFASGETVVIEVADDGKGIDVESVSRRAAQMGIPVPPVLDSAALLDVISTPGFSTRDEADHASGRGVGMSVVTDTIRQLGGSVFLDTAVDRGTRITLRVPLTLLVTDALIVSTAGQNYAVPQSGVDEVVQIDNEEVRRMDRAELVSLRGAALPLVRLRNTFGFPNAPATRRSVVLVTQTDRGKVGLVADRIVGQRQIVVRSIRDPLIRVAGVIGATEMGDGRPLLILDAAALARQGHSAARTAPKQNGERRNQQEGHDGAA